MTRTLTVEFVKITDRSCLARARRLDRAVIETMATARDGLPHDLEHLVVETALDCGNGFWGRVWRGAEFDSIRVATSGPRRRLARRAWPTTRDAEKAPRRVKPGNARFRSDLK
jgi:hypothetical protein